METKLAEQAIKQVEESDAAIAERNRMTVERFLVLCMQVVAFGWEPAMTPQAEAEPATPYALAASLYAAIQEHFPGVEVKITNEDSARALVKLWEIANLDSARRSRALKKLDAQAQSR